MSLFYLLTDMENNIDLSTVKGRLLAFLKAKGESRADFARKMGLSQSYVGSMRKSLPVARVKKMMEIYPDLNRNWLLYGEGDMFSKGNVRFIPKDRVKGEIVPLLPVEARAGVLQEYSVGVMPEDCEEFYSPVVGAEMAIRVYGDSMMPEFRSGDILLIKRINEKAYIPWGSPMVIDTDNGVIVKTVFPGKDESSIEARSLNTHYPPFQIPTPTIYGLYRILASVTVY